MDPVEHFKKLAKTLNKGFAARDPEAVDRAASVYLDGDFSLMRAQHVIAVEHGFKSWDDLAGKRPIDHHLAITMNRLPTLNDFGIGLFRDDYKRSREAQAKILADGRDVLRQSVDRVNDTKEWLLDSVAPIKTLNTRRSSYGVKHVAEKDIGYITNGVFIAAAVIAGYNYEIHPNSPNVTFGFSEKSLKAIEKGRRQNPQEYGWKLPNWTDPAKEARDSYLAARY
jgi:hypothetical protein